MDLQLASLVPQAAITHPDAQRLLAELARAAVNAAECHDWPERRAQWIAEYRSIKAKLFRLMRLERV